jgi:hypothetical protein
MAKASQGQGFIARNSEKNFFDPLSPVSARKA